MKKRYLILTCTFFVLFTLLFSCRKTTSPQEEEEVITPIPGDTTIIRPDSSAIPFPTNIPQSCAYAPDYGDTLICAQPVNGQDYIISPVNNPGAGKYMAWPVGMLIDSVTGAINVS